MVKNKRRAYVLGSAVRRRSSERSPCPYRGFACYKAFVSVLNV
jgi:hypothetical protein